MSPPSVIMLTPNGRFSVGKRLCLSISDYHPESWNPMWGAEKALLGLLSFMTSEEPTLGSMETTDADRRRKARRSLDWNRRHDSFRLVFPELAADGAGRATGTAPGADAHAGADGTGAGAGDAEGGAADEGGPLLAGPEAGGGPAAPAAGEAGDVGEAARNDKSWVWVVVVVGVLVLLVLFGGRSGAGGV